MKATKFVRGMGGAPKMRSMQLGFAVGSMTTLVIGWASLSLAAKADVAIAYDAPATCPAKAEFLTAIAAREGRIPELPEGTTEPLRLNIAQTTLGFAGTLRIPTPDGGVVERSMEDGNCSALVEALALIAVMELSPVNSAPAATAAASNVTAPHQPHQQPKEESRHDPTAPRSIAGAEPAHRWAIAAVVGVQRAATATALISGGAHLSLRWPQSVRSIGASVEYGHTPMLDYDLGSVRFRWLAMRLAVCPVGVRRGLVGIAACATTDIGLLRGEPTNTPNRSVRNGWWLAPGVGAVVSVEPAGWVVDWFGGVVRPIVRDEFYFASANPSEPREIANKSPALGLISELRVGLRF